MVTAGVIRPGGRGGLWPAVPWLARWGWLVGTADGLLVGGASGKLGVGGESDHVVGLRA